ncbi:CHAT domain-containing protein [Magnetospirillum sp. UT-4]|uniref:CHAT domain-containing protein n=1 Tax=Magnetospirillum sp. UT-4 TaxID=2681467 RepID=UPI0013842F72|nr:CHAT domain-containing protein [Magnetospirillum sp. UT-4]CAA7614213.1 TPR repeat [Magnetospirillum sp. UT-4]
MAARRASTILACATALCLTLAALPGSAPAQQAAAPDAFPAWVAERQAKASAIPQGRESAVAIWNRMRQGAMTAANSGNLERALQVGAQALSVASDNFGAEHIAAIISASELGQIQAAAGRLEDAAASYRTAIAAADKALGAGHPETLKLRELMAALETAQARYPQAASIHAEMAKAAGQALGAEHDLTLSALQAQGRDLQNAARHADADKVLAPVCDARAKALGATHPKTGACFGQRADLARQTGEIDKAAELIAKAMAAKSAPNDPASFETRSIAAMIAFKQGKLDQAQGLFEALIKDAEAAGDGATATNAKGDLVDVIDERGDYARAEALAAEVVAARTKTLGDAHPNTVAALSSLGSVYRKQGRLAEAEATFRTAYERAEKVLGADHLTTIIMANNLGEILEKQGLFDQAEPFLRSALDGSRRVLGETHPSTLIGLNNLGLLNESQGNFDKAEANYKSAIAANTKRLGASHPDTIAFVNNLAYLHLLKEEFDKAEPLFRQVVAAWTKSYGARHQNTLKARNSLARTLHRLGKAGAAEPMFKDVLKARTEVLGPKHLDVMRTRIDFGNMLRDAKRLDEAEAMLAAARAQGEEVLGALHPYTFEALNGLAAVKEQKGDLKGGFDVRATTFARRTDFLNRMLYVTGDDAREGYVRLHQPELAAYMDLATRMDTETAGRALLEVSLNRKGILFKVASELQQINRLNRNPELEKLGAELTETRKKLAALTLSGPTEETRDSHADVLAGLEARISRLQGDLGRASVRFQKTVERISLDELVTALPEGGVLIDFLAFSVQGKPRLVAATLRKDGGKPVFGLVEYKDPAAIDAAIQKYRTDIQDEEIDLDDMLETGQKTHQLIWAPLDAAVGRAATVYLVPDGMLNILPFTALVEEDGKYLIERLDLHIYTSSRNLLPSKLPPAKGGYMINAGPDYNSDAVAGKDTLEKARSRGSSTANGLRGMSSGMRGLKFDPLPGAEKEGQLIVQKVSTVGKPNSIYSKLDAQERVLRELSQPPEFLHIATHGFFLKPDDTLRKRLLKLQRGGDIQLPPPGDNPLLRAGLAFAGINANAQLLGEIDTDNDGVLTALEVLGLDLTGTRLAILSACETGLGEIHEGEGVYGLRRAFQEAGAGSVVSSLWEVSDAGTQTLMNSLYGRLLAGKSPHQALREAQLEMLRIGQWSSPYIWSAFFMVDG